MPRYNALAGCFVPPQPWPDVRRCLAEQEWDREKVMALHDSNSVLASLVGHEAGRGTGPGPGTAIHAVAGQPGIQGRAICARAAAAAGRTAAAAAALPAGGPGRPAASAALWRAEAAAGGGDGCGARSASRRSAGAGRAGQRRWRRALLAALRAAADLCGGAHPA